MKEGRDIEINRARAQHPPGGDWTLTDPVAQGRVQVGAAGPEATRSGRRRRSSCRAQKAVGMRYRVGLSKCAVIARSWGHLDPVRSLCELEGIPVQMANEEFTGVWHLRETRALVDWLRGRSARLVSNADLQAWLAGQAPNAWIELLQEAVAGYALETGGSETPVESFIEWLAEWGREVRRRQRGLLLLTAHRAKGLEFDHVVVLDGDWARVGKDEDADAPRRLYYVAMTRAMQTLTLMRLPGAEPGSRTRCRPFPPPFSGTPLAALPAPAPELARSYRRFGLSDVFR